MKNKSIILIFLCVILCFSGCGESVTTSSGVTSSESQSTGQSSALQEKKKTNDISVCFDGEPVSLDPARCYTDDTKAYALLAFEGLYKLDENGKPVFGQAQSAKTSEDGLTWNFTLRNNIKWSDGIQVKAEDFVYAWKRAAAMKNSTGRELFYWIEGGEKAVNGDVDSLQVKALSDTELEVTLITPCDNLPEILTQSIFMPLREDFAGKDNWSEKDFPCNGAMKISYWNHKEKIKYDKNTEYYNKDNICVDSVTCTLLEDDPAKLYNYLEGSLQYISTLTQEKLPSLRLSGSYGSEPLLSAYSIILNVNSAPFDKPEIRKALSLALDKETLRDEVMQQNSVPVINNISDIYANNSKNEQNKEEAKKLLEDNGFKNIADFPTVVISVPINTKASTTAEKIAKQWKDVLGINCKIESLPAQKISEKCELGDFQVTLSSISQTYNSNISAYEKLQTNGADNIAGWSDKEYDNLINKARKSASNEETEQILLQAQEILSDNMPVIPLFAEQREYLRKPTLVGCVFDSYGTQNFLYTNTINQK